MTVHSDHPSLEQPLRKTSNTHSLISSSHKQTSPILCTGPPICTRYVYGVVVVGEVVVVGGDRPECGPPSLPLLACIQGRRLSRGGPSRHSKHWGGAGRDSLSARQVACRARAARICCSLGTNLLKKESFIPLFDFGIRIQPFYSFLYVTF